MPRLLVHVGLHKTGTTALQGFLLAQADALRAAGVLYPRTGRLDVLGGGHHNIAWEAARDRRFCHGLGTIDKLAEEIATFGGHAVVSSEDFESCLTAPNFAGLGRLACHPLLRRWQPTLAIFLREQAGYLESLYTENLNQRAADAFGPVLEEVVAERRWRLREWVFQFDYLSLWEHLRRHFPGPVVIVDEPGVATPLAFMRRLLPGVAAQAAQDAPAANPRQPTGQALRQFYEIRVGRAANPAEASCIAQVATLLGHRRPRLTAAAGQRFHSVFDADNRQLARLAGIHGPDMDVSVGRDDAGPSIEVLYSFEMQVLIERMSRPDIDPSTRDRALGRFLQPG